MSEPSSTSSEPFAHPKSNTFQGIFVILVFAFVVSIFFFTDSLRPAALITLLNILILNPFIHFLQKKRLSKTISILTVFFITGILLAFGLNFATHLISSQWENFSAALPSFESLLGLKLTLFQEKIKEQFFIDFNFGITDSIKNFSAHTQAWLFTHLPSLLGDLASAIFLVPFFSFFLLRDGEKIKSEFFRLVPSPYYRPTVLVITKITHALSEFLRAKLLEAFFVGALTFLGLTLVHAPYAGIFALVTGATNIIPYLGPLLGAVPALTFIALSDSFSSVFWPVLIIFVLVNVIDLMIIFPVFVAKLVNLSPFTLLAAVAVGQEFYGLVGMLIAVPLASILKIIYQELVQALYEA